MSFYRFPAPFRSPRYIEQLCATTCLDQSESVPMFEVSTCMPARRCFFNPANLVLNRAPSTFFLPSEEVPCPPHGWDAVAWCVTPDPTPLREAGQQRFPFFSASTARLSACGVCNNSADVPRLNCSSARVEVSLTPSLAAVLFPAGLFVSRVCLFVCLRRTTTDRRPVPETLAPSSPRVASWTSARTEASPSSQGVAKWERRQ